MRVHEGGLPQSLEDVWDDIVFSAQRKTFERLFQSRGITEQQILAVVEDYYGTTNKFRDRNHNPDMSGLKGSRSEEDSRRVALGDAIDAAIRGIHKFLDFLDQRVNAGVLTREEAKQYREDIGVVNFAALAEVTGFYKAHRNLFGEKGQ